MKKKLILLVAILMAGVVSFCLMRSHKMAERQALLRDCLPELAWVRTDLKLTDGQLEKVTALHTAYLPKCMAMCHRIATARDKVRSAAEGSRKISPELEAAIREHAQTRAQCQQAMLGHLYETAAILDDNQASRYLEAMLPFALEFDPNGSGDKHHQEAVR